MNTIVNERKLGFLDIVSEGLKIFFFKFKEISLLTLASLIPAALMTFVLSEAFPSEETTFNAVKIFLALFILAVQMIVSLITTMSIAVIIEKVVDNKRISVVEAIKHAASKSGTAFTTSLLAGVIIFGLTLLFVIPGIIYWTYYIFVLYVVVLRDKHGKEALDYSKALVAGQWWRVSGILLGIGIIFVILNGIITYPLTKISDSPYFAILPNVVSLFLSAIFGVMNVVLFLNNDFVYHQRLARRTENEQVKQIKRAPTIDEYLATRENKIKPAELSISRKVTRKTKTAVAKKPSTVKKSTAKKRTVKKGTKTVQRKAAS